MDPRCGIEPLEGSLLAVVDTEVGDQDPALPVHVDPVGRAAPWPHPYETAVRQDLGDGALVVRGEDPSFGADHDILGAVDAQGDLLE